GQSNSPAVRHSGRNAHIQCPRARHDSPCGIELRDVHRQRLRGSPVRLLERQRDRGLVVLAAGREREGARAAAAAATEAGLAEQRLEEVAEAARAAVAAARTAEMKLLLPVGGRPELLTGLPVGAERVVGSPLLLVAQHFVRFADFLEALLGVRLLADVRMVLARKAAIRPFDLVL